MSRAEAGSPPAMPDGGNGVPIDAPAVAEALRNVRRLLREMETGPAFRNGWEYRFAALAVVVWPGGLDRRHLADVPLARRTRNCLRDADLLSGTAAFTTGDLLLPNFGARSYRDLLAGVDGFLAVLAGDPAAYVPVAIAPQLLELARRTRNGEPGPVEMAKLAAGLGSAVAILRARLDRVVAGMSPGQRTAMGARRPRPDLTDRRAGGAFGFSPPAASLLGSWSGRVPAPRHPARRIRPTSAGQRTTGEGTVDAPAGSSTGIDAGRAETRLRRGSVHSTRARPATYGARGADKRH